jgi:uncharacterized protein
VLEADGALLVFNAVSSQLVSAAGRQRALLEEKLREVAATGSHPNPALLAALARLGLVVPRAADERGREHARFLATKASGRKLLLTIAPTMGCNLRCTYCFQQEMARAPTMRPEIQEGLVEFVSRKAEGADRLAVQWFGGEPLLAYDTVLALSERFQRACRERGVGYHSEMLTNGTLLDDEIVASFPSIALRAVQFPLDGMPATYAARKRVSPKKAEEFYERLAGYLPAVVEATGSVTIRINVDRDNAAEAKDVVRFFAERGVRDQRIDFRLGFLNTSRGVIDCIPHNCLSTGEFADLEIDFCYFLAAAGYRVFGRPEILDYPCAAVVRESYAIGPDGRIGKCVPAIGTDETVFSRIYPGEVERTLAETAEPGQPFADFDPFETGTCRECSLLPACLGSCPKGHRAGGSVICALGERLAERLAFYADYEPRNQAAGRDDRGAKRG